MNNHKSVSGKIPISPDDCVAGILVKDFQKLRRWMAENNLNEAIPDAYRKGIQEGRRQEVERAKNYLKRLCWNDKDIELFEKWQSRNEGSEKHGE